MFYFLNMKQEPCEKEDAVFYRVFWKDGSYYFVRDFYLFARTLKETGLYIDTNLTVKTGRFESYHANKQLDAIGAYNEGKKVGLWKEYSTAGKLIDSAYYKNGKLSRFAYSWYDNGALRDSSVLDGSGNGYSRSFHKNGSLLEFGKYLDGTQDSIWTIYDEKGQVMAISNFQRDSLISYQCFDENGFPSKDTCLRVRKAVYPGDDWLADQYHYLIKTLKYPDFAKENNISGRVVVRFEINRDGVPDNFTVIHAIGGGCDEEALRAARLMPKWKPARFLNIPVKTYYSMPIQFILE